jgi:hypothetical protein
MDKKKERKRERDTYISHHNKEIMSNLDQT